MFGKTKILDEPWEIYAGDMCSIELQLYDGNTLTYIDTSGVSWRAAWRQSPDSNARIDIGVAYNSSGRIVLTLTSEQSKQIDQDGYFDVQGEKDGRVFTILAGRTSYRKDVAA